MKFICYLNLRHRFNFLNLLNLGAGKTVKCPKSGESYRFGDVAQIFAALLGLPCFMVSFYILGSFFGAGSYVIATLFTPVLWLFSLMLLPLKRN